MHNLQKQNTASIIQALCQGCKILQSKTTSVFFCSFTGQLFKQICAKSLNSKQLIKIKMACLQQFLQLHLPLYYQSVLKQNTTKKNFFDFDQPNNLFSQTADLLSLAHYSPSTYFSRQWLSSLINRQLTIPYEVLKHYRMPIQDSDSTIVQILKSSVQPVDNYLLQLQLRFIAIFLECFESQYLNNTTMTLIQEISYIYPALKTQISINYHDKDLTFFLQKYLTQASNSCNSQAALLALERIKNVCNFIGATQKIVDHIISQKKSLKSGLFKKLEYSSPNDSEEDSDRLTKNTKEVSKHFSEAQLFRKKRNNYLAKPAKQSSLKPSKTMTSIQVTPLKHNHNEQKFTPKYDKKSDSKSKNKQMSKSPVKKTPLFKKIRKQRRPLERTIYFGQTKKFIPKRTINNNEDIFQMKDNLYSKLKQHNLFENFKKTEKKIHQNQVQLDNAPLFYVPETPRPILTRKKIQKKNFSINLFKILGAETKA